MPESRFEHYGEISKLSTSEQRMVYGYLTTGEVDAHGDIVTADALEEAFRDYWGNIREMHQDVAAGVVREFGRDDKGFWIGAYIGDDQAWRKCKDEIYKGFSIRGPCLGRDPNDPRRITKLKLREISLVDRGANSLRFELVKLDDTEETDVATSDLTLKIDTPDLDAKIKRAEELKKLLDDASETAKSLESATLAAMEAGEELKKLGDAKAGVPEELEKRLGDAATVGQEILTKLADGDKAGVEIVTHLGELIKRVDALEGTPRGVDPATGRAPGARSKADDDADPISLSVEEEIRKLGDNPSAADILKVIHDRGGQGPLGAGV